MDAQELKEQVIRMEGWADGVKFGAGNFAKWVVDSLAKEAAAGIPAGQGATPPTPPSGN